MHNDAYHLSLALIDHLASLLPHIHMHDRKLAGKLRNAASSIPQHIITGKAARIACAHAAAARVLAILDVAQAWSYVPTRDIAEAQHTACHVHQLTAP